VGGIKELPNRTPDIENARLMRLVRTSVMSATIEMNAESAASQLARLIERLEAPDLTVAEANALRPKLLGLLDALAGENAIAGSLYSEPNLTGELTSAGCAARCAVA
jgi:hypothetical protein